MAIHTREPGAWQLAVAGLLSLAVAMGIGRFAFTPLLPLMMRDGQLGIALGSWIAAANYAGYLAGALTAHRVPLGPRALGVAALLATAALTAAMAWPSAASWLLLRFLAGVASAWAFVATAIWCLGALARAGRSDASGVVYAGVGVGIAFAGLWCAVLPAWDVDAAALWLQLGAMALLLCLPVLGVLARVSPGERPGAAAAGGAQPLRGLVICYGVMGFGYILPATFLPVLARTLTDDPRVFGLAWPVFGATAAVSTLMAAWFMRRASRLRVWACCQALMAVGALLPAVWLGTASVLLSALLVGGTFMVITLAGVQEARARAGAHATAAVGAMTAAFAAGQIAGPALSALLLHAPGMQAGALRLALMLAAVLLAASAAWLWSRPAAASSTSTQEMSHVR
jgi:MFS family permease